MHRLSVKTLCIFPQTGTLYNRTVYTRLKETTREVHVSEADTVSGPREMTRDKIGHAGVIRRPRIPHRSRPLSRRVDVLDL